VVFVVEVIKGGEYRSTEKAISVDVVVVVVVVVVATMKESSLRVAVLPALSFA